MRLFRVCFNKAQMVYGRQHWAKLGLRSVTTIPDFKRKDHINPVLQRSLSAAPDKSSADVNEFTCPTRRELENVFKYHGTDTSIWIIEEKANAFCVKYAECNKLEKLMTIVKLAKTYGIQHEKAEDLAYELSQHKGDNVKDRFVLQTALKSALTPMYFWLFVILGRLENGIRFLVNFRRDVLELEHLVRSKTDKVQVAHLNSTLQDLLFQWFSAGFLQLERVTWESACDVVQKISEYEAIHPVKGWMDIKERVGPYRRCYIFTHPALPRDPIVVLHTALCGRIAGSIKEIRHNTDVNINGQSHNLENKARINAAVFYSIMSTNKGLTGMQMGNYMIKQVLSKIREEFPHINKFSSLSPIPDFKTWFLSKVNSSINSLFYPEELAQLEEILKTRNSAEELAALFATASWVRKPEIESVVEAPLMRSCAYYLCAVKKGTYARNSVENFHLSNGAMIWRINWLSNKSLKAFVQSFGITVNYRYYPEKMEEYGRKYVTCGDIIASEDIIELSREAGELMQNDDSYSE